MKFFVLVCIFGLLIGILSLAGCNATTWPGPKWMQPQGTASEDDWDDTNRTNWSTDRTAGGKATGWDNRARDIERNLGYE